VSFCVDKYWKMVYNGKKYLQEEFIMELCVKDKVLLAIYKEYQNNLPNMDNITPHRLDLVTEEFQAAIDKLENEYLITGAKIEWANNKIYKVFLKKVKPTEKGLHYCENMLMNEENCEFLKPSYVKSKYKVLMDTLENYEASGHAIDSTVHNYVNNEGWHKISEIKDDTNILIIIKK
jgi:hypothetical protein